MQSKGTKVFNLLVTLTLRDCEAEKQFKDVFLPYAMWVNDNEPNTLMYTLMKVSKATMMTGLLELTTPSLLRVTRNLFFTT